MEREYGKSPCDHVLPDIIELQRITKEFLRNPPTRVYSWYERIYRKLRGWS